VTLCACESTPPGAPAAAIRGAFFADAAHGWVVATGPGDAHGVAALVEEQTSDGGRSWVSHRVAPASPALEESGGLPAQVGFVDGRDGWILAPRVSSANFSVADLFVTHDGGTSWTQRPAPFAGEVSFADASTGWIAGGPGSGRLDVTHDGGVTWTAQALPFPSGQDAAAAVYSAPTFVDATVGYLPVTLTGDDAIVDWFRTVDAGRTWTLRRRVDTHAGSNRPDAAAATPAGSLLTAVAHGARLDTDGTAAASQLPIDANAAVTTIRFDSPRHGIALLAGGVCRTFKSSCGTYDALFATSDAGSAWKELRP
jgi:photosystem II stability/assembly factor-like uncharacterized protein